MQVSFILKQLETGDVCWILDPSTLPLVLGTCAPCLFHPSTFLPPTLLTFHFSLAMLSFLFVVLCFSLISVFSFLYITPTTPEKACFTENHAFSANSDPPAGHKGDWHLHLLATTTGYGCWSSPMVLLGPSPTATCGTCPT
jgi:hypothetical protein